MCLHSLLLLLSLLIFLLQIGQEVGSENMNNSPPKKEKDSHVHQCKAASNPRVRRVMKSAQTTCTDPVRSSAKAALTPVSLWSEMDTQISFPLEAFVLQNTEKYFPHLRLYTYITSYCVWDYIKMSTGQILCYRRTLFIVHAQRFKSSKLQFHLINPCWLHLYGPISCPLWLSFFLLWA